MRNPPSQADRFGIGKPGQERAEEFHQALHVRIEFEECRAGAHVRVEEGNLEP